MAATKQLIIFPLAIMIIVALLGIFIVGLAGNSVHVDGYNGQNTGLNGMLSNGVVNGLEPLGGGITNNDGTTDGTTAVQATDYNLDTFVVIAVALSAAIVAVVAIGTIAGFNIFGSGLNSAVSDTILHYGSYAAVWLVLTAASSSIFFGNTPMGIGLVFYAILTICYLLGTVFEKRGVTA